MSVLVAQVEPHSPAARKGVKAGDLLLSVNGNEIEDVLDYRFYIVNEKLNLRLLRDGKEIVVTLRKREEDDPGLLFDTYLMDRQQSCRNQSGGVGDGYACPGVAVVDGADTHNQPLTEPSGLNSGNGAR